MSGSSALFLAKTPVAMQQVIKYCHQCGDRGAGMEVVDAQARNQKRYQGERDQPSCKIRCDVALRFG